MSLGYLVHLRKLNVSDSAVLGINFYQWKWKVFTHSKLERNQTLVSCSMHSFIVDFTLKGADKHSFIKDINFDYP